jgi:hypothetical protein
MLLMDPFVIFRERPELFEVFAALSAVKFVGRHVCGALPLRLIADVMPSGVGRKALSFKRLWHRVQKRFSQLTILAAALGVIENHAAGQG